MSDDAPRRASFSSAFSIVLSSANDRITELGCTPVGEDPHSFVDRGGLRRLETEAAAAAIKRVREAAYPLIFKLFGAEMPSGRGRKVILSRLGQDLKRIEETLAYGQNPTQDASRKSMSSRMRSGATQRRRK